MVSRKSSTPDLFAIYHLEFYRKQKNWKFCASKHKNKIPKHEQNKSRNFLNATYNVDGNANQQDKIDLNVAFCELELDQKPPSDNQITNCRKHKELSQDWLEPINIWPDNVKKKTQTKMITANIPNRLDQVSYRGVCQDTPTVQDAPKKTWIHERLEVLMQAAKNRDLEIQSEPTFDIPLEPDQELNQQLEPEIEYQFDCDKDRMNWNWMEYSRDNHNRGVWSEPGWMHTEQLIEDVWQRDYDVIDGPDEIGVTSDAPGEWLDDMKAPWLPDEEADRSLDSASEFIRGAHVAPHSSELELPVPIALSCEVGAASLCVLSASQLAVAVRSQSQLLARLLHETARRRKIQKSLSLAAYSEFSSFEECPTRDVGLSPGGGAPGGPRGCGPFGRDALLAGSHWAPLAWGPGRGRGRLPDGGAGREGV